MDFRRYKKIPHGSAKHHWAIWHNVPEKQRQWNERKIARQKGGSIEHSATPAGTRGCRKIRPKSRKVWQTFWRPHRVIVKSYMFNVRPHPDLFGLIFSLQHDFKQVINMVDSATRYIGRFKTELLVSLALSWATITFNGKNSRPKVSRTRVLFFSLCLTLRHLRTSLNLSIVPWQGTSPDTPGLLRGLKETVPENTAQDACRDFPSGPVMKTLSSQCRGTVSIPGQGTKIPHTRWHGKKNKRKCSHTGPSLMNVSNFNYVKLHVLVSERAFIECLL